jgi:hypothetical protein
MEALPLEVIDCILSFIPIPDLHANVRFVSKAFGDRVDIFFSSRNCLQYIHSHWGILWTLGASFHKDAPQIRSPGGGRLLRPLDQGATGVLRRGQQYLAREEHRRATFAKSTRNCMASESQRSPEPSYLKLNGGCHTSLQSSDLWAESDGEDAPSTRDQEKSSQLTKPTDPLIVRVCFDMDTMSLCAARQSDSDTSIERQRYIHLFFAWSVKTCLSVRAVQDGDLPRYLADVNYRTILNALCEQSGMNAWYFRNRHD